MSGALRWYLRFSCSESYSPKARTAGSPCSVSTRIRNSDVVSRGTLQELFQQLSEQETYQTFSFLSNTLIAMQQVSFTEAWKTSVQADKELSPDSQQMLCELGEELGISDLYTQKEILERYRSRMQQMEAEQRETSRKKIRLYQSMGLLAGMAVAILLC